MEKERKRKRNIRSPVKHMLLPGVPSAGLDIFVRLVPQPGTGREGSQGGGEGGRRGKWSLFKVVE